MLQETGYTALVIAAMLNNQEAAKVVIAAQVARGLGVDHQTVRRRNVPGAVVRSLLGRMADLTDSKRQGHLLSQATSLNLASWEVLQN